ncbi:hypothetical protein FRB94_007968 [Tulasnella sp. JGI-2019a]|nr:hypothetical protein FRB93_007803 [Tulasnella sp. JGI-2019a]KAG8996948.1 hypothetical protein FRB94_007968 [Tulasnella sp. JGI-2019a]
MEAVSEQPPETVASSVKKEETEAKMKIGREKKEAGDKSFKEGDTKAALRQYHEAMMYVQGIDKSVLGAIDQSAKTEDGKSPKTEADVLLEKLQSNICACHIKNENWKRAVETANQILKKSPENKKALLRKGKGLLGQGFTEKAVELFQTLEKQDPEDAEVKRELAAAKAADKAATSKGLKKFKGFLNKSGGSGHAAVEEVTNVLEESRIEEVP